MTAVGGRGGKGGNLKDVKRLWAPPWDDDLLQIPGESDIGGEWRLAGIDPGYGEGVGGVEEDKEYLYQRGGKVVGVHIFIPIPCSVSVDLLCGDVGG